LSQSQSGRKTNGDPDSGSSYNRQKIPWVKWSEYPSTDKNKPDSLEVKVIETETFETGYSTAVKAQIKKGAEWVLHYLPLKSKNSKNCKLKDLWDMNTGNGRIKPGAEFTLQTHKRKSETSDQTMRDHEMLFKDEGAPSPSSPSSGTRKKKQKGGEQADET
jgi:hypothetical protein